MPDPARAEFPDRRLLNPAAEPKELMIIDGADHVDLYDQMDVIPFDRLAEFFGEHLAA